jgi:hypothetical protein
VDKVTALVSRFVSFIYPFPRHALLLSFPQFNILYRWHPTLSVADEQWTEGVFKKAIKKPWDTITVQDFAKGMRELKEQLSPDPADWEFGK